MEQAYKYCPHCKQTKPVEEFSISSKKTGSVHSYCRPCTTERNRNYRKQQQENGEQTYSTRYHRKMRMVALLHYSDGDPKCQCCGERRYEFLSLDHIEGNGRKHRAEMSKDKTFISRWLKQNNYPPGFRVLCHNCNLAIGAFGYCPHELEKQGRESEVITIPAPRDQTKRQEILRAITETPKSAIQMAEETGRTRRSVSTMLTRLKAEGLVVPLGGGLWKSKLNHEP